MAENKPNMLAKMVAVFNTSLLNTCQVQSIDLDVGVVGGIENMYLTVVKAVAGKEGGCRERTEGFPMANQVEVELGTGGCRRMQI